jgi:2-polyprenyl-6-methoxyphenol hydroxylase-like FAD-dependent oxidoreductase
MFSRRSKAIVIGASMAGLLAARVLADYFDKVILLERDTFPEPGLNRKGVPQGKHTHVLLEKGRQIMERYLPGLTEDLMRKGAVYVNDVSLNISWFHSGGFHKPGISGISGVAVSRPTLEQLVREHVCVLTNVSIIENCSVSELTTSDNNDRVTGVNIAKGQNDNSHESLYADLVVDASGRGSHSPAWLEKLGYRKPDIEEVRIGMGYTTCYYRRNPEHIKGLDGIVLLTTPPNKRMGIMLAQDGNRWVVTIGGYLGDHITPEHQEFLKAANNLPIPHIYNVIKNAELVREPVSYKIPSNLRRRYERLSKFPEGYLVFGDALCSFNPIYGQGMTVAVMEATALDKSLQKGLKHLSKRFFAKVSKVIDLSWNVATGNDLSFPEVRGNRTNIIRFLNWYIRKLHAAAHHDADVSIAFLKVINMIAPPPIILQPKIMWRIAKNNLKIGFIST